MKKGRKKDDVITREGKKIQPNIIGDGRINVERIFIITIDFFSIFHDAIHKSSRLENSIFLLKGRGD